MRSCATHAARMSCPSRPLTMTTMIRPVRDQDARHRRDEMIGERAGGKPDGGFLAEIGENEWRRAESRGTLEASSEQLELREHLPRELVEARRDVVTPPERAGVRGAERKAAPA